LNNRRYYTLSKLAYNSVIKKKINDNSNNTNLLEININYGMKLLALMMIDVILSMKNYDFILGRIYNILKTININENKALNTDMISTIILVLYNTLESYKPIL